MHPWSKNLQQWWRSRQPSIQPDVRSLLQGQPIPMVFQPVVDLKSAAVIGHEALMRESPSMGNQSFDQLLAAAKAQHCQKQLEIACMGVAIKSWSQTKPKGLLFVNVSARTLVHLNQSDGSDALLKFLEKHQMDPERMGLDVTDYSRLANVKCLVDALRPLQAQRVTIALDNFKATESTMAVWANALPSLVKMAPRWTRNIAHNSEHQKVVRSLVRLAKNQGVLLVAKSVESESELHTMHHLGVDMAQGYFLGSPARELDRAMNLRASTAFRAVHKNAQLTSC